MNLCAYLAELFTPGEIHAEKKVTAALGELCHDPIGLRRLMVECEALVRTTDGAQYQRSAW